MSPSIIEKRKLAVKVADTLNGIEGVPVTDEARRLSEQWSQGQISGEEMKKTLLAIHKRALR